MTDERRDDWERMWPRFSGSYAANPARAFRERMILAAMAPAGAAPRVIDFGSGQGDLALAMREALPQAQIVGLERTRSGVDIARRRVPGARFYEHDLFARDAEVESALGGWADVATCSEVMEHVDDPVALLRRIRQYLRPGGRLVVTAPGGPMSQFDRDIGHRKHYGRADLRTEVERAGYRVEVVRAAGFPFFNLYKLAMIIGGDAVLQNASRHGAMTRAGFVVFHGLLRFEATSAPWGWQMFLVASCGDPGGSPARPCGDPGGSPSATAVAEPPPRVA